LWYDYFFVDRKEHPLPRFSLLVAAAAAAVVVVVVVVVATVLICVP
jgi:hypothetical protein